MKLVLHVRRTRRGEASEVTANKTRKRRSRIYDWPAGFMPCLQKKSRERKIPFDYFLGRFYVSIQLVRSFHSFTFAIGNSRSFELKLRDFNLIFPGLSIEFRFALLFSLSRASQVLSSAIRQIVARLKGRGISPSPSPPQVRFHPGDFSEIFPAAVCVDARGRRCFLFRLQNESTNRQKRLRRVLLGCAPWRPI